MSDEQLAIYLRSELERIAGKNDLVTVTIPAWMFRRMTEIVIGNVQLSAPTMLPHLPAWPHFLPCNCPECKEIRLKR